VGRVDLSYDGARLGVGGAGRESVTLELPTASVDEVVAIVRPSRVDELVKSVQLETQLSAFVALLWTYDTMNVNDGARGQLLPTTLSRPPAAWFPVMELRQQVARLEQQVLDHSKLESKLSTITDEPIQNAMVRADSVLHPTR
jgi:hypothetical protein